MKLLIRCAIIFILLNSNLAFANKASSQLACPVFPYFYPKTGSLAVVNCDFHKEYERRVAKEIKTFGAVNGRPVILNLGGTLLLKYNGKTEMINMTPINPYHDLKSFFHSAFTIFIVLSNYPEGKLDISTMQRLKRLNLDVMKAKKDIPSLKLSKASSDAAEKISSDVKNFLDNLLANKIYRKADLLNFREEIFPTITAAVKIATNAEISALNEAINKWLAKMNAKEREKIGIVVATEHQPRAEEISIQYFSKKFNKHLTEGAKTEDGLVVLEGKFDENSALKLLARHYLDREFAAILYNDPARLQRDLLADATKEVLSEM